MDINKLVNTEEVNARREDEDLSTLWDDSIIGATSEAGTWLLSMRVENTPVFQVGYFYF